MKEILKNPEKVVIKGNWSINEKILNKKDRNKINNYIIELDDGQKVDLRIL